jgi:hypothetical protein
VTFAFLPVVLMLGPILLLSAILYGLRFQIERRRLKTPLTSNLLRSPGESLRSKIDDLSQDVTFYALFMMGAPFMVYSIHLSQSYFGDILETPFRITVSVLTAFGILAFFAFKLVQALNLRRRLRLAHDAEMAVGQELNQLMLKGYHVYHDFPAEKFNIDHVVVGPGGVYAIETKARTKRTKEDGRTNAEVIYDGKTLQFPHRTEQEPIRQAITQAGWLKKWLSSAIGEAVEVSPVLTLPGWFVKRVSATGIPVINPRQIYSFLDAKKGQRLPESLLTRMIHQLDRQCRDVEPKAYDPSAKWS